ncbi:hypothetical protein [uncultured Fibrobacter sp.]|uniref:hypothetical protein n=1 Tax=uncultured Fibrobacter sp. TaxID=261512 RepID=UPI0025D22662|nr:hypothetical protein [uncultured Fibrobacter sp.]
MTREELHKAFTQDQIDWLLKNKAKPVGNSDAEVLANYAKLLWDAREWQGKDGAFKLNKLIQTPQAVYTLQGLAEAAGFSDMQEGDDKISAAEQFLDAYFGGEKDKGTRERWRTSIVDKYGEGAWEKAQKVIRRAENDRMNAGIAEARRKEIDPTFSEASLPKWATSALMGLFTPRRKQAFLEGRDPEWNETVGDIGQNVLYALPVGKIAQGAKAVAGSNVASKVLGNLAAQAAAPTAVVGMDQLLGNKDYTWDEALVEAGIGTATNLGVNKGIARLLGPAWQLGMGKVRGRLPQGIINFLEGNAPAKEKAQEKIDEARAKLFDHYRETVGNYLRRVAKGEKPAMLNAEELQKVKDIVELGDYIKSGEGASLSEALTQAIKQNQQGVKAVVDNIGKEPLWQLDTQTLDEMRKPFAEAFEKVLKNTKATPQTDAVKRAITSDPELLSLFYKNTPREAFDEAAANALQTWGVNKYGSDSDAGLVLNTVGAPVKELRKDQEKSRQERTRKVSASRILGDLEKAGTELTEEDTKWLKKIEQNPGMVQGYGEGNTPSFRNWMLLRGSDLLSGTPLYRPAFSAE